MKKKLSIILIIALVLGEVMALYEVFRKDKDIVLENIETSSDIFKNKNKMFTIMVENDNDYEYHEYEDRSKWPDKTKYTYAGSLCTDWGGNNINESIIKFDEVNYKATITTKKTAYCTLYFTKGKTAKKVLEDKGGSKFNSSSAVFGLYRFNGTQTDVTSHNLNNFVCFGTTDISTCTGSDKQYYMYRIIGITDNTTTNTDLGLESNQLKIIRAYPSNQEQKWHNVSDSDIKWDGTNPVADVQTYLNGSFLTTDKGKWRNGDFWEKIIDEPYWYIGDNTNNSATSEITTKSSSPHKVGLMYVSDFVNAGPVSIAYSNENGKTNWLFIENGMNGNTSLGEWTMTRTGLRTWETWNGYCAAHIVTDGSIYGTITVSWGYTSYVTSLYAVRPVFYLKSNVTLAGEGTEASPFIITSKN